MKTPLEVTPLEVTYEDSKMFIYATVHRYRRRHGGDFDDILSVANEAFIEAYRSFDPNKGTFLGCVKFYIWHFLLEEIRQNIRHRKRLEQVELFTIAEPTHSTFHPSRLEAAVSPQARLVLRLCLHTPPEITRQIQAKGGSPHNYRSVIRKYLMDLGWDYLEVNAAFKEIRDALHEGMGEL